MGIQVNAANYEFILNGDTNLTRNSNSIIYVGLKNINISNGLNVCECKLEYDANNLVINSIVGENGWTVTNGEKIIFDNSNNVKSDSNIGRINITLKNDTILKVTNINCTDGENEYPVEDYILNFNLEKATTSTTTTTKKITSTSKEVTTTIKSSDNSSSSNYKSSTTTEQKSTGVKEYCLIFIVISLLTYMIFRIVKKKDIFKKI